jgi:hypothetical protein
MEYLESSFFLEGPLGSDGVAGSVVRTLFKKKQNSIVLEKIRFTMKQFPRVSRLAGAESERRYLLLALAALALASILLAIPLHS